VPELPEVETIVRCLRPRLTGLRIEGLRVLLPALIREKERPDFEELGGARITGLRRRGKMILIDCSGGRSILFHLKMTGRLLLCPKKTPPDKHTHLIVSFHRSGRDLRFRDVRKFGFVRLVETSRAAEAAEMRRLGPEPLDLDAAGFRDLLGDRRGQIKPLLLNQNVIAGIGNIYADEILFAAGLHPQSRVQNLSRRSLVRLGRAVPQILEKAIRFKGTTVRDYRDGEGLEGGFQNHLRVYGREGLSCPRCGRAIRRTRVSGRSSYFCPRCQRRK
jgi:formamidopyrimidine-DNA glycosylase